jgi:hypothetical protein
MRVLRISHELVRDSISAPTGGPRFVRSRPWGAAEFFSAKALKNYKEILGVSDGLAAIGSAMLEMRTVAA